MQNILTNLPNSLTEELTESITAGRHVRIERIISTGQASRDGFWYDQPEHEWVCVLKGEARLLFMDGRQLHMSPGDHVLIEAHQKHRVEWTTPHEPTVWLAVFYSD